MTQFSWVTGRLHLLSNTHIQDITLLFMHRITPIWWCFHTLWIYFN